MSKQSENNTAQRKSNEEHFVGIDVGDWLDALLQYCRSGSDPNDGMWCYQAACLVEANAIFP